MEQENDFREELIAADIAWARARNLVSLSVDLFADAYFAAGLRHFGFWPRHPDSCPLVVREAAPAGEEQLPPATSWHITRGDEDFV